MDILSDKSLNTIDKADWGPCTGLVRRLVSTIRRLRAPAGEQTVFCFVHEDGAVDYYHTENMRFEVEYLNPGEDIVSPLYRGTIRAKSPPIHIMSRRSVLEYLLLWENWQERRLDEVINEIHKPADERSQHVCQLIDAQRDKPLGLPEVK